MTLCSMIKMVSIGVAHAFQKFPIMPCYSIVLDRLHGRPRQSALILGIPGAGLAHSNGYAHANSDGGASDFYRHGNAHPHSHCFSYRSANFYGDRYSHITCHFHDIRHTHLHSQPNRHPHTQSFPDNHCHAYFHSHGNIDAHINTIHNQDTRPIIHPQSNLHPHTDPFLDGHIHAYFHSQPDQNANLNIYACCQPDRLFNHPAYKNGHDSL